MKHTNTLLLALGLSLVTAGLAWWSIPLALIVVGLALAAAGGMGVAMERLEKGAAAVEGEEKPPWKKGGAA